MRLLLILIVLAGCQKAPPPAPRPAETRKIALPPASDPAARLTAPAAPAATAPSPMPSLEWLIEARGPHLTRAALLESFDERWRRDHDLVRIYGWRDGAPRLIADDSGDGYERVTLALQLLRAAGDDDLRVVAASHLQSFVTDVTPRLRRAGAAEITTPATPADGAATAVRLRALFMANGCELTLRLLSPDDAHPFDGKTVLDVLLSLGLTPNAEGEVDFAGFEVKTRTPPGRLDPAALLDGKMRPTTLVFELYVPHAARPVESWALLSKAADYAQKRLGGRRESLMEDFGRAHPTDEKAAGARVAAISAALDAAGFPAGSPATLRLFSLP